MEELSRWATLREPLRGAAYVIGLGLMVCVVGFAIAAVSVRIMT